MKTLIFISLVLTVSSFQLQPSQIVYRNGNGRIAWNGTSAFYENGRIAWNGTSAFYENGSFAWNGTSAFHENGQIFAGTLNVQIQNVTLHDLQLSELKISDKIKLLTKTFKNKVYVVGLKIQLSEKNSILINKEDRLTTNIIQLNNDIHFEAVNRRARLSVLGQKVVNQN